MSRAHELLQRPGVCEGHCISRKKRTRRNLLAGDVWGVSVPGRQVVFLLLSLPPNLVCSLFPSAASLDKLLDAGLYTGEVTEIVGGPGSGKTQVHMRPAVRGVRPGVPAGASDRLVVGPGSEETGG